MYKTQNVDLLEMQKCENVYSFNIGDIIAVHIRTKDAAKERTQIFQGICIAKRGTGIRKSFIVRRTDFKGRIEMIFPYFSPSIKSIVIKQSSKVRRAKLYYLRNLFGRKAILKRK